MITKFAITAGTLCYFTAAFGFAYESKNYYTSAVFVLYGICNALIMLGSR